MAGGVQLSNDWKETCGGVREMVDFIFTEYFSI